MVLAEYQLNAIICYILFINLIGLEGLDRLNLTIFSLYFNGFFAVVDKNIFGLYLDNHNIFLQSTDYTEFKIFPIDLFDLIKLYMGLRVFL